jgi:hypothetical protein
VKKGRKRTGELEIRKKEEVRGRGAVISSKKVGAV